MTVIVCVDDRLGVAFNKRRQSRDRVVVEDILKSAQGGRLVISPYSKMIFADDAPLTVSDNPLDEATENDFVFIEDRAISGYEKRLSGMIIYRWNKLYPSDRALDVLPTDAGLRLKESAEFKGYSHEKITKEIYLK